MSLTQTANNAMSLFYDLKKQLGKKPYELEASLDPMLDAFKSAGFDVTVTMTEQDSLGNSSYFRRDMDGRRMWDTSGEHGLPEKFTSDVSFEIEKDNEVFRINCRWAIELNELQPEVIHWTRSDMSESHSETEWNPPIRHEVGSISETFPHLLQWAEQFPPEQEIAKAVQTVNVASLEVAAP